MRAAAACVLNLLAVVVIIAGASLLLLYVETPDPAPFTMDASGSREKLLLSTVLKTNEHAPRALRALQNFEAGHWVAQTCARSLLIEEQARMNRSATLGPINFSHPTIGPLYARALVSTLGNQRGCHSGAPTKLREWRPRTHRSLSRVCARASEASNAYSSIALMRSRALYERTTCFVGDSVMKQLYGGLMHNLERLAMLRPQLGVAVRKLSAPDLPYVNATDCCGRKRSGWTGLNIVEGFAVHIAKEEKRVAAAEEQLRMVPTIRKRTEVHYYKHYVWSPWDAELIASNCDVVIFNIGLHYDAHSKEHRGMRMNNHPYAEDERGAMAWLANFSATAGKLALWRETLPQHFNTSDGLWSRRPAPGCVPRAGERASERQQYNNITGHAWNSLCVDDVDGMSHRCDLQNISALDEMGALGESLLGWWRANNYTAQLAAENSRQNTIARGALGVVWKWPLFHLFDGAWEYHLTNDCTHFCYVPELFNAAFETLRLVLQLAHAEAE